MNGEMNDQITQFCIETSKTMEYICKAMLKINEALDEQAVKIKAIETTLEHWEKRL